MHSALRQTLSDIEVLVVNDGSSDDTHALAESIEDERVRIFDQANAGVASARNTGLRHARGRLVAFLDADDLWVPNKLERQIDFMDAQAVRASQTGVWFVDNALRPLYQERCKPYKEPLIEVLLFKNLPAFPSSLLIERDLLSELGGFREDLVILEDWELAVRLAWRDALSNFDEALTMYRVHVGNRSRNLEMHIDPGMRVLRELFSHPDLPDRIRSQRARVYAGMYTMFSGGALRAGHYRESIRWGIKAIDSHPAAAGQIARMPARKLRRVMSRRLKSGDSLV